ncbi:MAG TPA: serine hydrolase [Bryobacteraceae bacterium]
MEIQAYHGVTGAQHQTNFNNLTSQGYRMISLSVYGDPGYPLYAAVWVQRPGPAWGAVHGVDSNGYQSAFNTWTSAGYVPVLVSATGTIDNAVFAAVFEQGISGAWFAKHGMTSTDFQSANAAAFAAGQMIRSFAIYGTSADRRYAGIWHPNPLFVKWHSHVHPSDTAAQYQTSFNAETQLPGVTLAGYRPAYLAVSGDVIYCSVFKDDWVGPWVARHGMTSSEYQTEFNQEIAKGFYPICVQGGGTTASPVYAAIFAQQDIPNSRQWSVTGAAVTALAAFDQVMQWFMQANGVRAAQFGIGKNGAMQFSRAYTWAEPQYRATQTSDRFLLASCSKMFLEAAIQSLYNAGTLQPPLLVVTPNGREVPVVGDQITGNSSGATATVAGITGHTLTLVSVLGTFTTADHAATMSISGGTVAVVSYTPSTAAYPLLGFSHPADSRSDNITIQQLLDHQGGYNDGTNPKLPIANVLGISGFDPTYNMGAIAQAIGVPYITSKRQIAQFMYAQTLQFTPGTNSAYSNYGYLLLGAIIEKLTGMDYFAYLTKAVLQPNGLTEIQVFSTLASGRSNNEAIAEDEGLGISALNPASPLLVPSVYGGDGEINEIGDPNDGLCASAETLAQFIFRNAVWGNGGRAPGYTRDGSTPGASTWASSRWDGVDWALVLNTLDWPPATPAPLTAPNSPAATSVVGSQALTQSPFTLKVSPGGTGGFSSTGTLLVTNSAGVQQPVQYSGLDPAANAFTGCTALLAGAGSAANGAAVMQTGLISIIQALLSSISIP